MLSVLKQASPRQQVWDFVTFSDTNRDIKDLEKLTYYDDSHGHGDLSDARDLSFTTKDKEVWLLPSESYLDIDIKIERAVRTAPAVAGEVGEIEYNWAADAAPVTMADNGCNMFDQSKYYIEDQEIEKVDHTGIATLVDGILKLNEQDIIKSKHKELWFLSNAAGDAARKTYLVNCAGHLKLEIPLKRLFTFCENTKHAFRGVQHRITFSLQHVNNILLKTADASPAGKAKITKVQWVIPKLEPSLQRQAEVESTLASGTSIDMQWPGLTVYKSQPPKQQNVRIQLASTIHRPNKILVGLQRASRTGAYSTQSSMVFDHLNLEECNVSINSKLFPNLRPLTANFARESGAIELYNNFIHACSNSTPAIDYETFKEHYPLWYFDVSNRADEIYDTSNYPQITINLKFQRAPTNDYYAYVIIYNEKSGKLSFIEQKMIVKVD